MKEDPKNKRIRRFNVGIILIIFSSTIGWGSLIIGGIQSITAFVKIHTQENLFAILLDNTFIRIYFLSWIVFLAGAILSGPFGWQMWKRFLAMIFQQERLNSNKPSRNH